MTLQDFHVETLDDGSRRLKKRSVLFEIQVDEDDVAAQQSGASTVFEFDDQLAIMFDVEIGSSDSQPPRTVTIRNLDSSTITAISGPRFLPGASQNDRLAVDQSTGTFTHSRRRYRLSAGYGDDLDVICEGNVLMAATSWNGVDRNTVVSLGADPVLRSGAQFQNVSTRIISRSWPPGATLGQIVEEVAEHAGLNFPDHGHLPQMSHEFAGGEILVGEVIEQLNNLLRRFRLSSRIDCGVLSVVRIRTGDAVLNVSEAELNAVPLITRTTGLIGVPDWRDNLIEFKHRMSSVLRPGRVFFLISNSVEGYFEVTKSRYYGDTWKDDWYVEVTGAPVRFASPTIENPIPITPADRGSLAEAARPDLAVFIAPLARVDGQRPVVTQAFSSDHQAIDISYYGGSNGRPVRAARSGTVEVEHLQSDPGQLGGEGGTYGNFIILDHGGGYRTLYAHLQKEEQPGQVTVDVPDQPLRAGDRVVAGEIIGYVGFTGLVKNQGEVVTDESGAHLHFEVHLNGFPIDPAIALGGGPGDVSHVSDLDWSLVGEGATD